MGRFLKYIGCLALIWLAAAYGGENGAGEVYGAEVPKKADSWENGIMEPVKEEGEPAGRTEGKPGHLIQATTFRDEYMGMVNCGGTVLQPLEEPDVEAAYEKVRRGIVRIEANGFYGSGVIWEMKEDEILVISNRHLLEHWDKGSRVLFYGGAAAAGQVTGLSDKNDIGYLRVDTGELRFDELVRLRAVNKEVEAYEGMAEGDALFIAGSADGPGQNMYQGTFASGWWYIEEFDAHMILGFCYGKPGMSGGGTFDARGNFIGMLSGGTGGDEIASLPVSVILEDEKNQKGR